MFCKNCGRNIVSDSRYCSYCGEPVGETDVHEEEVHPAAHDDDCIRPRIPKKNCTVCGKELPGSTVSDTCALCTMRLQNQEVEAERKRTAPSVSSRDRYDVSSQFDQSIFERDKNKYYHDDKYERGGIRAMERDLDPKRGRRQKQAFDDRPKRKKQTTNLFGIMIVIIFVMILSTIVPIVFSALTSSRATWSEPLPEPTPIASTISVGYGTPELPLNVCENDVLIGIMSAEDYDTEMMFRSFLASPSIDMLKNYYEANSEFTVSEVWFDLIEFTYNGAYNYLSGEVIAHNMAPNGDILEEDVGLFSLCIVVDETGIGYIPVSLTLKGEQIYDYSDIVNKNGEVAETDDLDVSLLEFYPGDTAPLFFRDLL